jgi:hypothetical protein
MTENRKKKTICCVFCYHGRLLEAIDIHDDDDDGKTENKMKDKKGEKPARKECTKVTPQRRVLDYLRRGICSHSS